jgi:uncharacterized protein
MDLTVSKNVKIAMRDGVALATDIYRITDEPRPVIFTRLPYDKELSVAGNEVMKFINAGYHVVAQDTRGRFASDGVFNPFFHERSDGEDTLKWITEQSWSNGDVAMVGLSYYGATQWMLAAGDAPALKAISPNITGSSYYEGWTYQGGAFELGFTLIWTLTSLGAGEVGRGILRGTHELADLTPLINAIDNVADLYTHTPLNDVEVLAKLAPYYNEWLAHPTDDAFWRDTAPRERYDQVTVPSLNIGGWYDLFIGGTLANYQGIRDHGGSDLARKPRLIVGPWAHGVNGGEFPSGSFGMLANSVLTGVIETQIRFFDHYVRGVDNGIEAEPPVKIFVMGANVWRNEDDWPLPDTKYTPYYLHSSGRANSSAGDGALSISPPAAENFDAYLYDPRNPVPTVGGQTFLRGLQLGLNSGPRDRAEIETRSDVLCYTTPALREDTEVTGPISLVLHISSSAVDTDFTGALVDLDEDGKATILTEGILRARYRNSMREPERLQPGTSYELTLDLWATSNVFKAGHRIRLEVSSSNFPRFDRNSNTGGTIAEEREEDFLPAMNLVLHGPTHPSRLILPIIER